MRPHGLTLLERAFELARSGSCSNVTEVIKRLKAEGYPAVDFEITGRALRRSLLKACQEARRLEVASP